VIHFCHTSACSGICARMILTSLLYRLRELPITRSLTTCFKSNRLSSMADRSPVRSLQRRVFDRKPTVQTAYLATVKKWLDANPNEVLTFLFTNPEGLSLPAVWAPAFQSAGIDALAYVPPSVPMKRTQWPTLGEMIDSGKRVVVFLDAGADGSDGSVNYILPEFEMVRTLSSADHVCHGVNGWSLNSATQIWEPPFDSTDNTFPCSVDRTAGPLATSDHMYLLNHFLDEDVFDTGILISDPGDASTTNSVASCVPLPILRHRWLTPHARILANAARCAPLSGGNFNPSFVLMDFVNLGVGVAAVSKLNGF
jgi:hypothetical protein